MMKAHVNMVRGKGTTRVSSQQVAFELKHRILLALNKVGDRDTYQIGVEELDKTIESLTADGVAPFLSCILDTDSEQKSAVRKECVRLMGAMATFHESLVLPHLGKIVASIVKRLKDSDSIVKDACVETIGVLASKFSSIQGESDGIFIALVKPLFEALGEQNKHVQSGAALCLARVIDSIHDPPVSIMQKMLAKTVKLLKNPHFMAKPAVIELNRSIIQAGGAPTNSSLSAAIGSIQESLKNTDWITRKAASAALGEIASSGGAFFGSFKSSSLRCLESCRFDKVKPVRDTALQALQIWRSLPGSDTPEPSEAGSSIKENFYRDEYIDVTSTCESTPKDLSIKKVPDFAKKRIPLSFKRQGQNCVEKAPHPKAVDWRIEIAVPKAHSHSISVPEVQYEESQCSSVSKTCDTNNACMRSIQDVEYEYVHVDDKQECSSASSIFPNNFESKASIVCSDVLDGVNLIKTMGRGPQFSTEETSAEEKRYTAKMQNRESLESTVTESCSQTMHGCCSQTAKEVESIRQHLLEIENKQSDMMDLLKVFTSNMVDTLSMIQMKVSGLEEMIDGMPQEVVRGGRHIDIPAAKFFKKSQEFGSPRISNCTPRPSVELCNRKLSSIPTKSADNWEDKACTRSRQTSFSKPGVDMWTDPSQKQSKASTGKGIGRQPTYGSQARKADNVFAPVSSSKSRQNTPEMKDSLWRAIEGYLTDGDLDTAYGEALFSGNELVLFELLDRTGPVLDNLSLKTASNLMNALAAHLFKQRFVNPILPWLQQMVDLSAAHGPEYLIISAKAKREILSAVKQAVSKKFSNPAERRFITELAMTLHHLWGQCS